MKKLLCIFLSLVVCFSIFVHSFNIKYESTGTNAVEKSNLPTIIIDAGHGGFDGGASTKDGYHEKNINLAVSLYLNEYLKLFGFNTILTRDTDTSLEDQGLNTIRQKKKSDIHNRMKIMEDTANSVYISIHQNFYSVEKYKGMQVFYSRNFSEISSVLSQCIQDSTTSLLQPDNERQIKECGTSVYLIYNAKKPACLVECGFLSNNSEAQLLKTPDYQKKIAYCIASGIQDFYYKD